MRIVYHHRTLGDGAEGVHVSSMVSALRDLGQDVRVAALIGSQTNVATGRTRALGRLVHWTPRPAYEAFELGYTIAGYRLLMRLIREWRPHVLYERYSLFNLAGVLAARRARIPLVLEVNAPLAYERATYERLTWRRLARHCERLACTRADVVLAVSTPLKAYLVSQGVPLGRVKVLPNGVDPTAFKPDPVARRMIRERHGLGPEDVLAGFSGILRPWHGVELLLEALSLLGGSFPKLRLLVVGDGPSRSHLEASARRARLESRVIFTGRVPHEDIPRHLAACDIGVSPQATFYASPMKIPEYMATGLAVLAPRMANIQDLVREGETGLLFRPEDAADLAATLATLVRDPDACRALGARAREHVVARGSWRENALQILDLVRAAA